MPLARDELSPPMGRISLSKESNLLRLTRTTSALAGNAISDVFTSTYESPTKKSIFDFPSLTYLRTLPRARRESALLRRKNSKYLFAAER